jgi:hypothetical protein
MTDLKRNESCKARPLRSKEQFLLHDRAPTHNGVTVTVFSLHKKYYVYQPSYLPDLTLANYFLFPN